MTATAPLATTSTPGQAALPGTANPVDSPRCLVLWLPDWPVTAWLLSERPRPDPSVPTPPVAVVGANRVLACSDSAREAGVRRGLHQREAQANCPGLRVVPADPARDARVFDPLVARLEELTPGVQIVRPGLVAIRARGPARYYGGEAEAAATLILTLRTQGVAEVRAGVADGVFAAEQAAYSAQPVLVVPPGRSAAFLAGLPVDRLGDPDLAGLLVRLGVRRLGDFATLDQTSVQDRFGLAGVRLQDLARGLDRRPVTPRVPPADLTRQIEFETPFDQAEPVVFSVRRTAEDFIAGLGAAHLVCTELRVVLTGEDGEVDERVWLHPTAFSAAAVVDRVRWQLASLDAPTRPGLRSGVVGVRLEPVAVDAAWRHEPGLFGASSDERVHHTLSRLQSMLGYDGVVTASIGGGRWLAERQVLVPWGERAQTPQPGDRPWPGHLSAPLPAVVFPCPRPVTVLGVTGRTVQVDGRGNLSSAPRLMVDGGERGDPGQGWESPADPAGPRAAVGPGEGPGSVRRPITAWAGPWPIDERDWDPARRRHACRFQVVAADRTAWLLILDDAGSWWIEGQYD